MKKPGCIQTVTGTINPEELGLTLPHEHLFTDLRGPLVPNYAKADSKHVLTVMKPYLDEVSEFGVTAIVECSTIGVGRNPAILNMLSQYTGIHIIAPTGVYREAYVPPDLLNKTFDELAEIWVRDIKEGIDNTNIKAGFIKMSVSDEGISEIEAKNLKAAVQASQQTGAVVASHTIGGELVLEEMELLENYGLDLNRFIWTHAQSEMDTKYHLDAAKRGVIISIDAIGSGWVSDQDMLEYTLNLIDAGFVHKILLSHDAGWYDPSQPDGHPEGNGIRGYTAVFESFIPELIHRGVADDVIEQITIHNPAQIFSLQE